jgi:hypothetical protein
MYVEKVAASLISWMGGGVQPANRGKLAMFGPKAPIWDFLEKLAATENPEDARTAVHVGEFWSLLRHSPRWAWRHSTSEPCGLSRVVSGNNLGSNGMSKTNAGQKPGEIPNDPFPIPARPPHSPEQTPSDPVNVPPPAPDVIFPNSEPVGVPPAPDVQPIPEPPGVF